MPPELALENLLGSVPHDPGRYAMPEAVVVDALAKRYADGTEAVRGLSFRVEPGEIFGILGPNGAGKSTTMGMLGTLVRPTAGRAVVAGYDVAEHPQQVRRRIGFAMQEVGVDELATARELLVLHGRLHGLSRAEAARRAPLLLEVVSLEESGNRRLGEFSGGMKRRIDLASALIHLPPVVFLDEPTEGLDPHARSTIWDTLARLRERLGVTILLTTHYMEEADRLCDRIAIVDHGQIVATGTPDGLKRASGAATLDEVYLRSTGRILELAA